MSEKTKSAQILVCAWCGWQGPSPVKRTLRKAGHDYPIPCRNCGAVGLGPIETEVDSDEALARMEELGL